MDGGSITVANSSFDHNSARDGGAVYIHGGSITVANSSFDHNSATHEGGAVHMNTDGYITVANSSFDHNSATNGGAVCSVHATDGGGSCVMVPLLSLTPPLITIQLDGWRCSVHG